MTQSRLNSAALLALAGMAPLTVNMNKSAKAYSIVAGDTYDGLAKRFDTTRDYIKSLNPGIDPRKLQIGQSIDIPDLSDRERYKRDYGFDPYEMPKADPMLQWQQMYHESVLGKYDRPIGAPAGNTAFGLLQTTQGAYDDAMKRHPEWFKGRTRAELATDPNFAFNVQRAHLEPHIIQWQLKNKRKADWETVVRMHYNPADPYGKNATAYFNRVKAVKWNDVVRQGLASSNKLLRQAMFRDKEAEYRKALGMA